MPPDRICRRIMGDSTLASWFVEEVFSHLRRTDQRRWADLYLHGLLSTCGRKSLRNMASSVCTSRTASNSLHQFINSSPWDWAPARAALARILNDVQPIRAITGAVAFIPKRGNLSVGVRRRFVPDLGRTINCQEAPALFAAVGGHAVPVDWRLMLDQDWSDDPQRRRHARLPEHVTSRPAWRHLVEMSDQLAPWLPGVPVVADVNFGTDPAPVASAFMRRGRDFVIEIRPGQVVQPVGSPNRAFAPVTAWELFRINAVCRGTPQEAEAACGACRPGICPRSRSVLVRIPGSTAAGLQPPQGYRLWAYQAGSGNERYWLTNLVSGSASDIVPLLSCGSSTRAALRGLADDFGLLDFEGRSYPGWHHHMTMVSAAYGYQILLLLRSALHMLRTRQPGESAAALHGSKPPGGAGPAPLPGT